MAVGAYSASQPDLACRLCGGNVALKFELRVLNKHEVRYLHCQQCLSLQSEPPFWLDEAYAANNLSNLDTGAAHRNLHNFAACWSLCKLLRLRNVVDIGGGDGLLCRLLRDYEINCFVRDKYATPTYSQGFEQPNFTTPDLVVAFEVMEHYPNPRQDLEELFRLQPKALLASTAIFSQQGKDWWYLAPEAGQHVFFYSRKALDLIADRYGYELLISSGYLLFTRRGAVSGLRRALARTTLKSKMRRLCIALAAMLPARGVWADHELQKSRM